MSCHSSVRQYSGDLSDKKVFKVALLGNPNVGKTTLFNALTGDHQTVGNWAGVTVEKKEGYFVLGDALVNIVDLPGMYSFDGVSLDEAVASKYLLSEDFDLIVNVIDVTNLSRNLYLSYNIMLLNKPMVMVGNFGGFLTRTGVKVDYELFEKTFQTPIFPVETINRASLLSLKQFIVKHCGELCCLERSESQLDALRRTILGDDITNFVYQNKIKIDTTNPHIGNVKDEFWLSLKIIENDVSVVNYAQNALLVNSSDSDKLSLEFMNKFKDLHSGKSDVVIITQMYDNIDKCVANILDYSNAHPHKLTKTEIADSIFMHKYFGIPIFLVFMFIMFWVTQDVASVAVNFLDALSGAFFVAGSRDALTLLNAPEWLMVVVSDGLGTGVQVLLTILPTIFTLMFAFNFLENSGYLARVAFLLDKFLTKAGLPGKVFMPMIIGFGCNVPAIIGTRILHSRKERIISCIIMPFMSCGARLPVYALFTAAFFPDNKAVVMFSLYVTGFMVAIGFVSIFRKFFNINKVSTMIMELPAYRVPRFTVLYTMTIFLTKRFFVRGGKALIGVVLILGFLNAFKVQDVDTGKDVSLLELASIKAVPVFYPLGIHEENWPAVTALFVGVLAKEAVVQTITVLYNPPEVGADDAALTWTKVGNDYVQGVIDAFATIPDSVSQIIGYILHPFSPADVLSEDNYAIIPKLQQYFVGGPTQAYAYLLAVLLYFPCVATFATLYKEIGLYYASVGAYNTLSVAWCTSVMFYQLTTEHNILYIGIAVLVFIIGIALVRFAIISDKENEKSEEIHAY